MTPLGGAMASRPLHFIWILDCSGSMSVDGKVQALNNAIAEALPQMRRVAEENPHAQLLVRAVTFSDGARWHVAEPTPVDAFQWRPVEADGLTDMGAAMRLVADALSVREMPQRALAPVLILISDGQPTDDYDAELDALLAEPWGKKARRIAIAIGRDADHEMLERFIANPEFKPLQASSADDLVNYIKWASTAVVKAQSQIVISDAPDPVLLPPGPANELTW